MTDELVKRHVEQLRLTGGDLADLCQPIANAIEALTAERDAAYARGYSDAETEISKSALGQKIDFLHSQYAKYEGAWMAAEGKLADAEALIEAQAKDHASNNIRFAEAEHRAKTAEAERNQLCEALEQFLIEYDVVDLAHAEPSSLTEAVLAARAALKGESHD